jgi:glycosyltransferase involved in cell wall biosynthesis
MNGKVLLYQPYMDEIGHFRFFFELWRQHLTASGYEVTGMAGFSKEPDHTPDTDYFVNPAKGRFTRILGTLKGLSRAFRLAEERSIPVLYIQDFEIITLSTAMWVNRHRLVGRRIVLHQHAGNFEVEAAESRVLHLYRRLTRPLFRRLLRKPEVRIIANGGSIAEGLERYTGVGAPTVIASTWGTRPGEPTAPSEPNHFLFAGILRKDKNLEGVLDAFSRFGKRDWSLTIAGRPMEYTPDEILGLIRRSGADATRIDLQLRFIDDDEWASFFSRATYVLIPYKAFNKSNSGPLIDALQYDCIPIVSDFGERGAMVRRLGIGYAFDFDKRTLIALLDRLLAQGHSNAEVAKAIRSVKADFTWPKILRDLTGKHRIFDP